MRAEFRHKRRQLPAGELARLNAMLKDRVLREPVVLSANRIFAYLAFGKEPDTRPILRELVSWGKSVLCPANTRDADPLHCLHILTPENPLLNSPPAQYSMPLDACQFTDISGVDVFLVPGLAWDLEGHRIGFGGGYFDKLLAGGPPAALKVGLAFEFQLIDHVPRREWDIPVDLLITDLRVLDTAANRRAARQTG